MAVKKLMFTTGLVSEPQPADVVAPAFDSALGVAPARLVKSCILVHSGHQGSDLTLFGVVGDVEMNDERIENIVQNQNQLLDKQLTSHYESFDQIPIGAFPPVLDCHDDQTTVKNIIGRMSSKLRFERRDIPKVGKNVACACAEITFLGAETVERVLDGRIYHLSIGIDEDTDTLTELSAVIEPAAKGAMVLSQRKSKGATMSTQLKAKTARIAKLKSAQKELVKLTTKMVAVREKSTLAAAERSVVKRLSGAMRGGKITRADFKGMDIKKLAALPKEAQDVLMSTIEALEPRIVPGQIGTAQAVEFAQLGRQMEKRQTTRLRAEIRGDLKKLGAKLKKASADEDDKDKEAKLSEGGEAEKSEKKASEKKMAGQDEDTDSMDTVPVVDQGDNSAMTDMQAQVDQLNTQIARVAGIVNDLLEDTQEDGDDEGGDDMDLGAKDDEDMKMGEDPEKKDDAKLADGEDSDEDKNKDAKPPEKKELADGDDKDDDKSKFEKK